MNPAPPVISIFILCFSLRKYRKDLKECSGLISILKVLSKRLNQSMFIGSRGVCLFLGGTYRISAIKSQPLKSVASALIRGLRLSGKGEVIISPYRRLPHHRQVDVNHLLGEQPLVQALDRLMAPDPPASSERSFKRGCDGFGSLVDADLTAFDALQPLPDVADRDRDDRQITSQRLLHHIRRSLLT